MSKEMQLHSKRRRACQSNDGTFKYPKNKNVPFEIKTEINEPSSPSSISSENPKQLNCNKLEKGLGDEVKN
ncbi:MAG: hypothetical protein R2771_14230 [Saprospiraceae bacterium]